uniref:Uncharacterized protein n=1 Tax=Glossina pallidipes TaxID=7398 RepID=A0A1A9Z942_GLOPL
MTCIYLMEPSTLIFVSNVIISISEPAPGAPPPPSPPKPPEPPSPPEPPPPPPPVPPVPPPPPAPPPGGPQPDAGVADFPDILKHLATHSFKQQTIVPCCEEKTSI